MLALCSKVQSDDVNQRVGAWQLIHIKTHNAFAALNVPSKKYIKKMQLIWLIGMFSKSLECQKMNSLVG